MGLRRRDGILATAVNKIMRVGPGREGTQALPLHDKSCSEGAEWLFLKKLRGLFCGGPYKKNHTIGVFMRSPDFWKLAHTKGIKGTSIQICSPISEELPNPP